MTVVVISIAVLVAIFAAATLLPINMGILALAGAFLVGSIMLGLSPAEIFEGFPSDLAVTLIGITYLFAIAQKNGSIDKIVAGAVRLVRGRVSLIPWIIFSVSALLTAVGALGPAAVAIVAPVALRFASHYRISSLLMGLMVIHGAQAGAFSPISVYGGITNQIVARAGLASDPTLLFFASLGFNTLIAVAVFIVLGRKRFARVDEAAAGSPLGEPVTVVTEPIVGHGGTPALSELPAQVGGLHRDQILTFIGLAALALGALIFEFNVGLIAITVASVLALISPKAQKGAIDEVSWSTVLLITGVITYVSVLQKAGTVDTVGASISAIGAPLLAALLLCYLSGVVSAFASSTALLGAVIPLSVPFLMQGHLSALGVVAAICISTTIVDTSPFSTNGALVVANAEAEKRDGVYRELLLYSGLIILIGPLLAWATFVMTGWF